MKQFLTDYGHSLIVLALTIATTALTAYTAGGKAAVLPALVGLAQTYLTQQAKKSPPPGDQSGPK